jgi:uncharacterized protein YegL
MAIPELPNEVAKKVLHFFLLVDCSGSMNGAKIASLNHAVAEALPAIRDAIQGHPEVSVKFRAIKFSNTASWHIGSLTSADPIDNAFWNDLTASGGTETNQAISILIDALDVELMPGPGRGYPPVCILLSDGFCTNPEGYIAAIEKLNSLNWGKKAVRLAVAIGDESEYNEQELLRFVNMKDENGNPVLLKAHNSQELVHFIKWASVAATVGASIARSKVTGGGGQHVNFQAPPAAPISSSGDVF